MLNTITEIKSNVALHSDFVQDDNLRNTTISSFYNIESISISIILVLNGFISDQFGILRTWNITNIDVLFILIIIIFKYKKRKSFLNGD
ncbi:hypothetical protein ACQV2S_08675 [Facklamia sp. P13064]